MHKPRPKLFRGRHFRDEIILLCVRWYLRYSLSYRDLEELMAERGLSVDHSTVARWVPRYAPICRECQRTTVGRPKSEPRRTLGSRQHSRLIRIQPPKPQSR